MQKYKKIKHMAVFYLFFIQINAHACKILHPPARETSHETSRSLPQNHIFLPKELAHSASKIPRHYREDFLHD